MSILSNKNKKDNKRATKRNDIRILSTPYIDGRLREVAKKKWYIKNGIRLNKTIYIIALTDRADEPIEIMAEKELYGLLHPAYNLTVVGLAADKKGAFEQTQRMYEDMYAAQGSRIDVPAYFAAYEDDAAAGGIG